MLALGAKYTLCIVHNRSTPFSHPSSVSSAGWLWKTHRPIRGGLCHRATPDETEPKRTNATFFPPPRTPHLVRLIRESDGTQETLATEVETADSFLSQAKGLMFRRSIPDDYALVFEFNGVGSRDVHMVFVPFPLDVLWLRDGEVQQKKRLSAWTGLAKADADQLIELPAGAADGVAIGDAVRLEE